MYLKQVFKLLAGILVAGLVFRSADPGLVRSVHANDKGCTLATLEGGYLWTGTAQASISQRDDPTYPRIFAGVLTFDGAGNLSILETDSLGGQINRRISVPATYTLDSDCSGAIHITQTGTNWDLFVSRDGSEGNWMRYDDGAIAARSFKKR